jgi:hypothetical protein
VLWGAAGGNRLMSEVYLGRGERASRSYWEMVAREIDQFNSQHRRGVTNEYGTRTTKEAGQADRN